MRLRRRRDRGFTLVELLISLALSMIGLLGLMALQLIAVRGNGASRNFTEATALAQEKAEALQTVLFANLASQNEPAVAANNIATAPASEQIYSRVTTVTFPSASQANILIDVSWADPFAALAPAHHVRVYTVRSP